MYNYIDMSFSNVVVLAKVNLKYKRAKQNKMAAQHCQDLRCYSTCSSELTLKLQNYYQVELDRSQDKCIAYMLLEA